MNSLKIQIDTVVSSPFEENTYLVYRPGCDEGLVVDPGLEPDGVVQHCHKIGIQPAAFLVTHGHSDHIGGLAALKQQWPACPVVIGRHDAAMLTDPRKNLSAMFGLPLSFAPADRTVDDGEMYEAAGLRLRVLEIPGHSAGHVVYLIEDEQPQVVLVGDVIFAGSIGRTDFPDGDYDQLISGIHTKLFTLPDDTILLPGHGPQTTVGRERQTNPFLMG